MLPNPNRLVYYCRNCGNKEDKPSATIKTVFRKDMKESEDMYYGINEYTKLDPTLPRTSSIPCPNMKCVCNKDNKKDDDNDDHEKDEDEKDEKKKGGGKVEAEVVYIRYNHEEMKYLYLCCHCDTIWKL